MRGLVGAVTMLTLMGWFSQHAFEMLDRMQDRVDVMQRAVSVREASVGIEAPPLIEAGHAKKDWKALLGATDDLPSGTKQRAVWVAQTEALLSGGPITEGDRRRLAGRDDRRRPHVKAHLRDQ